MHQSIGACDGELALAGFLGVNADTLAGWLRETGEAPDAVYLAALEIVAKGPFNPRRA